MSILIWFNVTLWDCLMLSRQKLSTILQNKDPWEWFIFKTLIMKAVLLIEYSDKKIIFRKIKLNLASKIDSENWKFPIFISPQSKGLTRYQKILLGGSFKCKNLWNFNCTIEKFHNCHHSSAHLIAVASMIG